MNPASLAPGGSATTEFGPTIIWSLSRTSIARLLAPVLSTPPGGSVSPVDSDTGRAPVTSTATLPLIWTTDQSAADAPATVVISAMHDHDRTALSERFIPILQPNLLILRPDARTENVVHWQSATWGFD